MEKYFNEFLKSSWGLELWFNGGKIYKSKKSGVKGLLDFIKRHGNRYKNIIIFDKIVGQGVALLAAYLGAKEIYGKTGSKLAAKALRKYKIKFYFKKTVTNILNKKGNDICPLEKTSFSKKPEEFYNCFNK